MNTGFYEYSQRKPKPQVFKHEGERGFNPDCLCAYCRAENQRRNPEDYTVFQSQPAEGARVTDLTQAEYNVSMKVLETYPASCYAPKIDKSTSIKVKDAPRSKQYVKAALILRF